MKYSVHQIRNGDYWMDFYTYYCWSCDVDIPESHPHIVHDNEVYCGNCAFKTGLIDSKTCARLFFFCCSAVGVTIIDGEVVGYVGKKPGLKNKDKEVRRSGKYRNWRSSVISRDDNKCKKCGDKDNLHAHHIKPFKTHHKQRFNINNGITLCAPCHRIEHSTGNIKSKAVL